MDGYERGDQIPDLSARGSGHTALFKALWSVLGIRFHRNEKQANPGGEQCGGAKQPWDCHGDMNMPRSKTDCGAARAVLVTTVFNEAERTSFAEIHVIQYNRRAGRWWQRDQMSGCVFYASPGNQHSQDKQKAPKQPPWILKRNAHGKELNYRLYKASANWVAVEGEILVLSGVEGGLMMMSNLQ